jgi:hypothetical protein
MDRVLVLGVEGSGFESRCYDFAFFSFLENFLNFFGGMLMTTFTDAKLLSLTIASASSACL